MKDFIIIAVVIVIAIAAIAAMVSRSGKKGCCGSASDYTPRKKKLKAVIATKTFAVEGMHCEKCSNRVTEIVNDISGVAGRVDLQKGTVTVSYETEVSDELITSRIQRAGYTVTGIE